VPRPPTVANKSAHRSIETAKVVPAVIPKCATGGVTKPGTPVSVENLDDLVTGEFGDHEVRSDQNGLH
jgi:hypothetical protein